MTIREPLMAYQHCQHSRSEVFVGISLVALALIVVGGVCWAAHRIVWRG